VSCKTASVDTKETVTTATEANPPETTGTTPVVTTASETTSTITTASETTSEITSTETTSTTTTTSTNQDTNLTQQEAIDIAMTVAKGTVDRVETGIEEGIFVWKVRIISDGVRTDIRIEDATGKVISVKTN
jgi:uncharacterized membrane protein YkoI